jgi:hypothetical protein
MQTIKNSYLKKYGYIPTDEEILNLFLSGQLSLTDRQENEIIKYFYLNQ